VTLQAIDDEIPDALHPGHPGGLSQKDVDQARDRRFGDANARYGIEQWFETDKNMRDGNSIQFLFNGRDMYKARIEMLKSARSSIYLSSFSIGGDEYSREVVDILCERKAHGVDVRVIGDYIGFFNFHPLEGRMKQCHIPLMYYNQLSKAGIGDVLYSMHEKIMVVDGSRMVVGGTNFRNGYKKHSTTIDEWQDMDAAIEGPASCVFHNEFIRNWKDTVNWYLPLRFHAAWLASHRDMIGSDTFAPCIESRAGGQARMLPIYSNPFLRHGEHPLLDHYLKAIEATPDYGDIRLYAPYFMPRNDFMQALMDAHVKRHVRIRVLTVPMGANDEIGAVAGFYGLAGDLVDAGVEFYLWPHKGMMHRKGGVFNHKWAFVGSDNLNGRGQKWNTEDIVMFDDPEAVATLEAQMDKDFAGLKPITRAQFDKGFDDLPWFYRKAFHLFYPLMQGDDLPAGVTVTAD
jgi:phosphatidylserine/phosphatidylglycerophosphate/cardiolipin synthase-like enzyme